MAKLLEARTLPEIIDLKIESICTANACGGVKVSVVTNLGIFDGSVGEVFGQSEGKSIHLSELKHYLLL